MKKTMILIASAALVSSVAFAQPRAHKTAPVATTTEAAPASYSSSPMGAVQGFLGFGSGAVNIGGEYEAVQSSNMGFGGYFFVFTKKDGVRNQVIPFGGFVKIHIFPANHWEFYVAPGFGLAMIDTGSDTETTFGPSFRLGAMYHFTDRVAAGFEHAYFFNWFSDKVVPSAEFGNLTVRFSF